jgi:hypothetical protein
VSAVATAERESAIFQVCDGGNRATGNRNDLGHPAQIRVAHADRTTGAATPFRSLKVSEVCIPGDVDTRCGIAGLGQKRAHLVLITLK